MVVYTDLCKLSRDDNTHQGYQLPQGMMTWRVLHLRDLIPGLMQKVVVSLSWFPLNGYGPPELGKGSTGISVPTTKIMMEETHQKFLAGVIFISLELFSVGFSPHRVNLGFWIHLSKVELSGDREKKLSCPIHGWNVNKFSAFSPFLYYTEFSLMTFYR